jgi:hypothetical protein
VEAAGAKLRYPPKYSPDLNRLSKPSASSSRIYEKLPNELFLACHAGSESLSPQ